MYLVINYKCLVSRSVSRYIVHVLHRCQLGRDVTSDDTWPFWLLKKSISHRNAVMETIVPDFVSTYHCIVFTDFQRTKLYSFHNFSLRFILKIFLKFRKFQPRYSYKIYSYEKECNSMRTKLEVIA